MKCYAQPAFFLSLTGLHHEQLRFGDIDIDMCLFFLLGFKMRDYWYLRVCKRQRERQRDREREQEENKKDMIACFSIIPILDFQVQNPRDCFLGVSLNEFL